MIDPLLTLSFNVQSQKGVYALLLGSGISRSSGILTGWEITLDLIRKLAHIKNERYGKNEVYWYRNKYKKDPDYSQLISRISPTSAAQQNLLKSYFEPSEEDRDNKKKLPTSAHKAIAKIVANGYIKVIITTNFDRLLESALEAEGVHPVIISSTDAAKGAPPISHSKCTIVKVHGDYLDQRIKNSEEDLSKYSKPINKIIDQIFDEYGLIISGWSGNYDIALRKALERLKSRRYPMYWTDISTPSEVSQKIIDLHGANFLKIKSADMFFESFLEKIESLEEFNKTHPISNQASINILKKYLSENKEIKLRDFLREESENAKSIIEEAFNDVSNIPPTKENVTILMKKIEVGCEKLMHLFAIGSFYAEKNHAKIFFESFRHIASKTPPRNNGSYVVWNGLRNYPALLLSYISGISAILGEKYHLFSEITSKKAEICKTGHLYEHNLIQSRVHSQSVMNLNNARQLIKEGRKTPLNDHLLDALKNFFSQFIDNEEHYERSFDNFEYMWCLLHYDSNDNIDVTECPFGAFTLRRWNGDDEEWIKNQIKAAIENSNKNWTPLMSGLFGGSLERLKSSYNHANPKLDNIANQLIWP